MAETGEVDFGDGIYTGELFDGVFHGRGSATYTSGDKYEGEWQNDAFHGQGKYTWADGDVYTGEYQHDKQHGMGTLKDAQGTYVGSWVDDARDGQGKQSYANGDVYEGEWHAGLRQGRGKIITATGASYEGEWVNDLNHGTGVSRNNNGDVYEGEFRQNVPHGRGHFRWTDGASYVGFFVNGVKHGEGCERLPDGTWVAGNWINGEHDKKQPVHKIEGADLAEHEALLQQTLNRLDVRTIQPMSIEKLKSQAPATTEPSSPNTASRREAEAKACHFTQEQLAGWKAMKLLGKGSFGAVYEAGLRDARIVCVKIVELGSLTDKNEMAKLQNEIDLMKRLHHPNIVQYYGCTEDAEKNTLNIFMEYVTGGSINHYIKKFKTIPLDTVKQWAFQIMNGVAYLHDKGIVHRDIKGDNILVSNDGVVKLADFGCSKAIDDVCSQSHGCKTMVGTPYWMAPEVITCDASGYGAKSDIWSVGCTVVEMITGKPAWPECDSMWAAVYKIANSTGLPTAIPKDLPPEMMDFLSLCFERNPAKRASARELLDHPLIKEFSN